MIMNYKEVEGIDENGNPTTFKIEIPQITGIEALENAKKRNGLPLNTNFAPVTEKELTIIEKELEEGKEAKELLKIIIEKRVNLGQFIYWLEESYNRTYEDYLRDYDLEGWWLHYRDNVANDYKLTETEFNKIRKEVC